MAQVSGRMRMAVACVAVVVAGMAAGGCAAGPYTVLQIEEPKIRLFIYEDPQTAESVLKAEGPTIQRVARVTDTSSAVADVQVFGTGVLHWGARRIEIRKDGIVIDGITVESQPSTF